VTTLLIFVFFLALYVLFIWKSARTLPILYIFLFVYFIQYVFSVYLIYHEFPALRKEMTVTEEQLFDYTLPALFFLFSGVFLFNKDINLAGLLKRVSPRQATNMGHLLLCMSLFFDLLSLGVPPVRSLLSFTYFMRYAAIMCYVLAPSGRNYVLIGLIFLELLRNTFRGGMFLDLFAWPAYMVLLASLRYNISFRLKFSLILIAAPLLIVIQSIKQEYRKATWSGRSEGSFGLLVSLAQEKKEKEGSPFRSSDGIAATVGRLNQGWHLGMVLKRVPGRVDFADGEEMISDLKGVILPRIFFPEKKTVVDRDKFKKYTGRRLIGGTAMTVGVLADFYINFGRWGSFVGLFLWGAVLALFLRWFIARYVIPHPLNMVWIPVLFNYVIRASDDFYIVANSLFKGFLLFLIIEYARKTFFSDEQRPRVRLPVARPAAKI